MNKAIKVQSENETKGTVGARRIAARRAAAEKRCPQIYALVKSRAVHAHSRAYASREIFFSDKSGSPRIYHYTFVPL